MISRRMTLLFSLLLGVMLLLALAGFDSAPAPAAFPHAKHVVENGMSCLYCHAHAEKSPAAGLPSVKKCMDCHSFMSTRTDAMQPLFEAWETQQPLRWAKHNDLPDHVVFPHHRHLKADLECRDCHGDVEHDQLGQPLAMKQCVACHTEREAGRNCSTCHK